MSSAPAPSEICEETAAVISQSGRSGASPAIFSSDVSRRGPSSWLKPSSGTIWDSNRPSSMARTARWWLSRANSSSWLRLRPHCSQISWAPRNWEISWSP